MVIRMGVSCASSYTQSHILNENTVLKMSVNFTCSPGYNCVAKGSSICPSYPSYTMTCLLFAVAKLIQQESSVFPWKIDPFFLYGNFQGER